MLIGAYILYMTDILNIIGIIDENDARRLLPIFCASLLSRIPTMPDDMADLAAIRHMSCPISGVSLITCSETETLIGFPSLTMSSSVRPSVCRLSVCNVRAPCSAD